jgi:hypothetical protein
MQIAEHRKRRVALLDYGNERDSVVWNQHLEFHWNRAWVREIRDNEAAQAGKYPDRLTKIFRWIVEIEECGYEVFLTKRPGRMPTAHGDENGQHCGRGRFNMATGLASAAELGTGASVVPHTKLARMTWRTHEWSSRAEEEVIPIDVICSPAPARRTQMIQAAIERCAGIDVGKKWLAVCIMVGPLDAEPRTEIRRFGTNVADLEQLRDWLLEEGITHAVMESTGSYWKPVFNILEETLTVYLANPHQVKPRKGHKTDNKDGYWLAHLLRHAMIQPSFIPPRPIRELRDLTRRRKKLIRTGVSEKNRIQKVLEDANVKLGNVLSDVFGVSGQLMLVSRPI